MRQHEGQAVHAAPLHFTRGDELVDHHLRAVGEVPELGFPNHQRVWVVRGVAVLEGQHSFFRQDGVDDDKRSLVVSHVLQRHIGAFVPLLTLLVMDDGVAVGKGATTTVFA